MALFLQHKTDDIQWAVWKMEESLEVLLALLPDARRVFCEQEFDISIDEESLKDVDTVGDLLELIC